jgi:DNA (cytosine-5)-methyltransferase 1
MHGTRHPAIGRSRTVISPPVKKGSHSNVLRVAELFAGVGGFRLGLERASAGGSRYQVVFSNQWEPGRKKQHASDVYVARFGSEGHVNADIGTIPTHEIPDHDVLVGGFPCQDYSVASTLKNSKGLLGRKGVLWWQIHRILQEKQNRPHHLILENVDRLLGSPVGQRGRDLALMLRSLDLLGYAVEWRVINAADHGMPQRRRRVFIMGHHKDSAVHQHMSGTTPENWMVAEGPMGMAFPCAPANGGVRSFSIAQDLARLSKTFGSTTGPSPFLNSGIMVNGTVFTCKMEPRFQGPAMTLGEVLVPEEEVPKEFHIPRNELAKWKYLKGSKKEPRTAGDSGHSYAYSEGAMAFPDPLDRPSRTIITGEGGRSPSRFKHVVCVDGKRYRRLVPVELERLNMFPDGHTRGVSDQWRAFFMGNALVVGVVERLGAALAQAVERSPDAMRKGAATLDR